ncbi:septum formation initiator [Sphingobacteriales bacterium UPWRP_1]|nr:hypothetical protein BVG80_07390 [Sphingobacteriales bacterium TSM_CSM]PSJ78251.1 septum formation initiator [Sphingobacteriales bacterium UPWRP_1]
MALPCILLCFLGQVNLLLAQQNSTATDYPASIKKLQGKVWKLQKENRHLRVTVRRLETRIETTARQTDSLKDVAKHLSEQITGHVNNLDAKITTQKQTSSQQLQQVRQSVQNKTLYGLLGLVAALLTSGLIYWLLHKKRHSDKTEVLQKLHQQKSEIEEGIIAEFQKQTVLIEMEIDIIKNMINPPLPPPVLPTSPNHTLGLKVANEINTIENNLALMDESAKGFKQLKQSVVRLKDNLKANGYEMQELLGTAYHQGLNLTVTNYLEDENLPVGTEIITKVIKPQVNFNGVMIQSAQVVVSAGS